MSRTYYRRERFSVDESIEDAHWTCSTSAADAEWFEHDATIHGDYVGAGVYGRSNIRVLREEFGDLEGKVWWECTSSYSTHFIRYAIEIETDEQYRELSEWLDGLDDYPCADECDLSDLEWEEELEAWENYGAEDFIRCLCKLAPHHDSEFFRAIGNDKLLTAWHNIAERKHGGEAVIHEQGGAYFPFDRTFNDRGSACYTIRTWKEARQFLLDVLND